MLEVVCCYSNRRPKAPCLTHATVNSHKQCHMSGLWRGVVDSTLIGCEKASWLPKSPIMMQQGGNVKGVSLVCIQDACQKHFLCCFSLFETDFT